MAFQEERFRALVACADDTIVVTDLRANVLFINEAGKRLIGAPETDSLIGLNAFELLAQESRADAADGLRRVLSEGVARNREVLVAQRDGTLVPAEMTVSVMRDEVGKATGYTAILRDISARKREQSKTQALLDVARAVSGRLELWEILDRVQRRSCEALQCAAIATFGWDAQRGVFHLLGHYGSFTPAITTAALEFRRDLPFVDRLTTVKTVVINDVDAQDWVPKEVLHPWGVAALVWTQLIVRGHPVGALAAIHTRPGAMFDPGQVELLEGIAQQLALSMEAVELYRQRQIEAENASALARDLDTANRTKSDFVAAIAHELRTPLSVITGYSGLMLDGAFGELAPEQFDVLQRIDRTTATLSELVNTLLDFSRLESGQVRLELEDADVSRILAAVEDETKEIRKLRPDVALRFETKGQVSVHTDPGKLKVILKNLIVNALKFTEMGEVSTRASAVDGGAELRVSDTGTGIPHESLDVIFDAFEQVPGTRNNQGGFGLGLYIVRRLLDLLGGRIEVDSIVGRGTTFVISLPTSPRG